MAKPNDRSERPSIEQLRIDAETSLKVLDLLVEERNYFYDKYNEAQQVIGESRYISEKHQGEIKGLEQRLEEKIRQYQASVEAAGRLFARNQTLEVEIDAYRKKESDAGKEDSAVKSIVSKYHKKIKYIVSVTIGVPAALITTLLIGAYIGSYFSLDHSTPEKERSSVRYDMNKIGKEKRGQLIPSWFRDAGVGPD